MVLLRKSPPLPPSHRYFGGAEGQRQWTCRQSAKGGHLKVLQWAHANGCPWDEDTCEGAVWGGHRDAGK
ncbi:hypothetical protein OAD67_02130 [bacterium]|nr:hypothetical protein [bacterium]